MNTNNTDNNNTETTLWVGHPSWWYFFKSIFFAIFFIVAGGALALAKEVWAHDFGGTEGMFTAYGIAAVLALIGVLKLLGVWIRRMSWTYTVTSKRVIERSGLIARKTSEVQLRNIRAANLDQSVLERLLSVGTVVLASAASEKHDVKLVWMSTPMEVKEMINNTLP